MSAITSVMQTRHHSGRVSVLNRRDEQQHTSAIMSCKHTTTELIQEFFFSTLIKKLRIQICNIKYAVKIQQWRPASKHQKERDKTTQMIHKPCPAAAAHTEHQASTQRSTPSWWCCHDHLDWHIGLQCAWHRPRSAAVHGHLNQYASHSITANYHSQCLLWTHGDSDSQSIPCLT